MIPLCDLKQQYDHLRNEIDAAVQAVCAGGQYILGPNVRAFEEEIADYCGCGHAVGVGSGTDALQLALRALGIGPGDEVITTPFTFIATSEAISLVGATPVFVDIEPRTFNIDVNLMPRAITPRTKAILPVHLYGRPCDMDRILEIARWHDLRVVEDCAQSLGAAYRGRKAGTFGDAGCLSFFPSKNLGCFGDGGMVVTDDPALAERVEVLRRHGGKIKYHHSELGLNSRLDEIQAAILRVKLKHLDRWNQQRRRCAYRYNDLLADAEQVQCPVEDCERDCVAPTTAVYHQYTVQVERRDAVMAALREGGIGCFPYYPKPLHLQEVHSRLPYREGSFPAAERAADRCLSLPMFPELADRQQQEVVDRLKAAVQPQPGRAKAA